MDQATTSTIPPPPNGQGNRSNPLTIAALATHCVQLSESPDSTREFTLETQIALEKVMLATEPRNSDEALTLARVVGDELESMGLHQVATTMESIRRGLERSGAKDLVKDLVMSKGRV